MRELLTSRIHALACGAIVFGTIAAGQGNREIVATQDARSMLSVAVSPDGQWLAAGSTHLVRDYRDNGYSEDDHAGVLLWPLRGDGVARGMRRVWLEEEQVDAIQSVAFSADSRRLVGTSLGFDRSGRNSGALLGQVSLCELPACDDVVRLLDDARSVEYPTRHVYPEAAAEGAVFTPDGKTLIAAVLGMSTSSAEGIQTHEFLPYARLVFYDLTTGKPRERRVVRPRPRQDESHSTDAYGFEGADAFSVLALSPDGRRVATAYEFQSYRERAVDVWSTATGRRLRRLGSDWTGSTNVEGVDGLARAIAFSPDGRWLATTGVRGTYVAIWNAATGGLVRTVGLGPQAVASASALAGNVPAAGPYHAVAFHPDGTRLVVAECVASSWAEDRRAAIIMWDVMGRSTRWTAATSGRCVEQLAFGPDGRWFAVSGSSGITLHDASTGALLLTLAMRARDQWVAWTPDGRYTGNDEGIARLAEVRDGGRARPLSSLPPEARVPDLLARVLDPR